MAGAASLPIQEHFVSVQGEGLLVGTPSSFVRVAGCNLRCTWCDSPRTSWTPEHTPMPLDAIVDFCAAGPRHVVLTGGEPLLHRGVAALSQRLADAGHHVTIETAGTTWLDGLHADLVSLSPKLAHSTPHARDPEWAARHEARRWQPAVLRRFLDAFAWQLKFVVRSRDPGHAEIDLAEITGMLAELGVDRAQHDRVLLMPECIDPVRLTEDYRTLLPYCRALGLRLGLRLHIELFGHTPGT